MHAGSDNTDGFCTVSRRVKADSRTAGRDELHLRNEIRGFAAPKSSAAEWSQLICLVLETVS
ncbi:MAG: hypothetical protein J07HR59_01747 [Halorubrum sp. J07HR59]|nr:MAG: hypothetical protein J07HR59_01747 [Halorubrum sp. J07HR59]